MSSPRDHIRLLRDEPPAAPEAAAAEPAAGSRPLSRPPGARPAGPSSKARPAGPTTGTVRAAQAGDVEAFEQLIAAHQAALFGFCAALLRSTADGEDAAQESLVKAYRRLDTYRFEAPFRTWLFQIARRTCQDRLRQIQRQGRGLRRLKAEAEPPPAALGPDRIAESQEVTRRVHAALAEIPEPFREVVALFDLQGWSYPEIAAACGVPVGTVKSRLSRGRDALRRALFHGGPGTPDRTRPARTATERDHTTGNEGRRS